MSKQKTAWKQNPTYFCFLILCSAQTPEVAFNINSQKDQAPSQGDPPLLLGCVSSLLEIKNIPGDLSQENIRTRRDTHCTVFIPITETVTSTTQFYELHKMGAPWWGGHGCPAHRCSAQPALYLSNEVYMVLGTPWCFPPECLGAAQSSPRFKSWPLWTALGSGGSPIWKTGRRKEGKVIRASTRLHVG